MTRKEARALISDLREKIGQGFHPDTRLDEYEKPLPKEIVDMEQLLDEAVEVLGEESYDPFPELN